MGKPASLSVPRWLSTGAVIANTGGVPGRYLLTVGGPEPRAVAVSTVVVRSVDPFLVSCPVTSPFLRLVRARRHFAVSLPSADSRDWRPGPDSGAPVLVDSPAWLECRLTAIRAEASGPVLVGAVIGSFWRSCADALAFIGVMSSPEDAAA